MNVKVQGILNAARYIEETYGREAAGEVLRACSPAVQERCATGIAITWHPLTEFTELLVVAQRVLGEPLVGEAIGAAGARANTRGVMLKVALLLTSPQNVIRRAASLWRQFNDMGELSMVRFEKQLVEVELKGVPPAPRVFCDTITGWAREMITSAGGKNATARHVLCRSNRDPRCTWVARWSDVEA